MPDDDNYLVLPDGRRLLKRGSPVPVIDPKRYPAHETERVQGQPTTGEVYMIDRLYMESVDMHRRAVTAEAKAQALERRVLDMEAEMVTMRQKTDAELNEENDSLL